MSGLQFGNTTKSSFTSAQPGFSGFGGLGNAPATTAAPAFSGFGGLGTAPATAAAPAFSGFGGLGTAPATAAAPAFSGFGGLGTATATTTAPAFSGFGGLGTAPATTAATAFSGFGGLGTATATTAAPAFSGFGGLGTAPANTTAPPFGNNKLNTAASTTNTGFSFPNFGVSKPATVGFTGLSTAPLGSTPSTTLSQQQPRGLGGVSLNGVGLGAPLISASTSSSGINAQGQRETKQGKDSVMPPELIQTLDEFKKYLVDQKKLREELPKFSVRPLQKVSLELSSLKQQVTQVENCLKRNVAQTRKLKEDVAHEEKHLGIAQRSSETSSVLQYENVAPTIYFTHMAHDFECRLRLYKQEIEAIEGLMTSQAHGNLTPKELVNVFKRQDDDFIGLAAKLYTVHEDIRKEKAAYIKRRRALGDSRDPFSSIPASKRRDSSPLKKNRLSSTQPSVATTLGPSAFQPSWGGGLLDSHLTGGPPTQMLGAPVQPPGLTGFSFGNQPLTSGQPTTNSGFSFGGLTGFGTPSAPQTSNSGGLFGAGNSIFSKPAVPTLLQPPTQGKKKKSTFTGF